jgi:hypothetical protein
MNRAASLAADLDRLLQLDLTAPAVRSQAPSLDVNEIERIEVFSMGRGHAGQPGQLPDPPRLESPRRSIGISDMAGRG